MGNLKISHRIGKFFITLNVQDISPNILIIIDKKFLVFRYVTSNTALWGNVASKLLRNLTDLLKKISSCFQTNNFHAFMDATAISSRVLNRSCGTRLLPCLLSLIFLEMLFNLIILVRTQVKKIEKSGDYSFRTFEAFIFTWEVIFWWRFCFFRYYPLFPYLIQGRFAKFASHKQCE